jgi:hypothetical protein
LGKLVEAWSLFRFFDLAANDRHIGKTLTMQVTFLNVRQPTIINNGGRLAGYAPGSGIKNGSTH